MRGIYRQIAILQYRFRPCAVTRDPNTLFQNEKRACGTKGYALEGSESGKEVATTELEYGEVSVADMSPDERRFFYSKSWDGGVCAICNEPVVDWLTHMTLLTHQSRYLICRHITSPEKYADIITNMWHFLHYDVSLIRDFDVKKDSKRRHRLHDTIKFLHQHNVILYSVYRWVEAKKHWARPLDFSKCLLAGEAVVRASVVDRISRIFQKGSASEISALTEVIMDVPAMSELFDTLQLNVLFPYPQRRHHKLTPAMKRAALLAMCGEMNWFVAKSRATDRAFNNALFPPSDTLVVHVLCHHAIESVLIEIVHYYIQKVVKETIPVWSDFRGRLPYIAGKIAWMVAPKRVYPKILKYQEPQHAGTEITMKPGLEDEIHRLTPIPNVLPKPIPSWKGFVRSLNLDKRTLTSCTLKISFKKTTNSAENQSAKSMERVDLQLPPIEKTKASC
ncbi:RNA editing complex protein MP44 [Perkinsela sp. CCAP 1560/4]|nr:RNA editing complex protein MP44 [Perkinsela sp. CCAP 1560/4]|eukprot:KNH09560.1 RNA editing complex protein MP44 [Perkinsela sp. CCAP 1560/4]